MAVLAIPGDVIELMQDSSLDEDYVANILVTADVILTKIYEYTREPISDSLLLQLQKYMAAHLIASTTKRFATDEKIGDAQISYAGKFEKGYDLTPYGQLLLAIDPTGLIARSGKINASINAIKSFD